MKSTFISTFAASILLLLATAVSAVESQYPTNEPPIDVCQPEVLGYRSLFVIDFTDPKTSTDGWTARPGCKLSRGDKALVCESKVDDPYFFSPVLADILPPEITKLTSGKTLLKIRSRRDSFGDGQVFYAQEANPDYGEGASSTFGMPKENEFCDRVVPLSSDGALLRLRFDLGEGAGFSELERIELFQIETVPIKFGTFKIADGAATFNLLNGADEPQLVDTRYFGVDDRRSDYRSTIEVRKSSEHDLYYPCKKAFEEIEVVATTRSSGQSTSRRFFAFNEAAADAENADDFASLANDRYEVRFAKDGSGAEIFRRADGTRLAAISPLICEEGDGSGIMPDPGDYNKLDLTARFDGGTASPRLQPRLRAVDGDSVAFDLVEVDVEAARARLQEVASAAVFVDQLALEPPKPAPAPLDGKIVGALTFQLNGDLLDFSVDAPRPVHAPVVRVLGELERAVLPGAEYLEKGEHSSSQADIETPDYVRYAPPASWVTQQFAAISTERGMVAAVWDAPGRPVFACPDFIDGDASAHRFNVCATIVKGTLRFFEPSTDRFEDAILWSIQERGLPEPPTPPRTGAEEDAFLLAAFERSAIKSPNGWSHAVSSPTPPHKFTPHYGSDFLSTIWELTGSIPETPEIVFGGGHIANYVAFLLTGRGEQLADDLRASANAHAKSQREDGSWRYSGRFLKGHWTDYASGDCANHTFSLLEYWRLTNDRASLDAALKGLAFINALKVPRGAQVWELSLHTPDIMGSSRCVLSNVLAYEATGDDAYLKAAERWALTGIPFVYLWENRDYANGAQPMMKYATIAVFGATGWVSPNWMGRPVQWCGLDYAYALILLAKHSSLVDWRKIAEGIVASAECQLCEEDAFVGLLPDSVGLDSQHRYAPFINPSAVNLTRRMLDGRPTSVSVVDVAGKRVVSPYPAKAEGNALVVEAKEGATYQILIDGTEVRTIESRCVDTIAF